MGQTTTMNLLEMLKQRSRCCELCLDTNGLQVYDLPMQEYSNLDNAILVCSKCAAQLNKQEPLDEPRWHCLNTAMWSEQEPVKITAWRMLNRLRNYSWAAEALDMIYLTNESLVFAKKTGDHENDGAAELHLDCNGNQLFAGDSVVLVKSLDVKGSSVNARLGTVIKNIKLVADNKEQIEGRIEGQMIVVLTKYIRKQGAGTE